MMESHLRKCPHQIGLCASLWCIFFLVDDYGGRAQLTLDSATSELVVLNAINQIG